MSYRPYPGPAPLLIGYDPISLPPSHLARLVEMVVEESVRVQHPLPHAGHPAYDPRLLVKVLIYAYATGIRSSRRIEQNCDENLAYLYLTRGDTPCYRTIITARRELSAEIEASWLGLFTVAQSLGMVRLGRIVVDSTKMRANASPESVLKAKEYEAMREELVKVLAEAESVDETERQLSYYRERDEQAPFEMDQMKDIVRRARVEMGAARRAAAAQAGATQAGATQAGATQAGATQAGATQEAAIQEAAIQEAKVSAPGNNDTSPPPPPEPPVSPPPVPAPPERPRGKLTKRMRERVESAVSAIDEATADGRKQVSLTDPDARMVPEGRDRKVRECHSFEIAIDNGLLVAGQINPDGYDNHRLEVLVEAAAEHEPAGVTAVDADSGYYSGDAIGRLLSKGLDICVPDSNTARDLRLKQAVGTKAAQERGTVPFTYDAVKDIHICPQGNQLRLIQTRQHNGQLSKIYRAQSDCSQCPLAKECLRQKDARRRTLTIGQYLPELKAALLRLSEPAYRVRYKQRGPAVETPFGFLRATLGYVRWMLRGAAGVACEAKLFKMAYQVRKIHSLWAAA